MVAFKMMECYESSFETQNVFFTTYPVRGNGQEGTAVLVGPYISRKRNPSYSTLVFQCKL